nr:PREDICTED: uncharacterized protein LOC109447285 [Rhinolophus sinicus]
MNSGKMAATSDRSIMEESRKVLDPKPEEPNCIPVPALVLTDSVNLGESVHRYPLDISSLDQFFLSQRFLIDMSLSTREGTAGISHSGCNKLSCPSTRSSQQYWESQKSRRRAAGLPNLPCRAGFRIQLAPSPHSPAIAALSSANPGYISASLALGDLRAHSVDPPHPALRHLDHQTTFNCCLDPCSGVQQTRSISVSSLAWPSPREDSHRSLQKGLQHKSKNRLGDRVCLEVNQMADNLSRHVESQLSGVTRFNLHCLFWGSPHGYQMGYLPPSCIAIVGRPGKTRSRALHPVSAATWTLLSGPPKAKLTFNTHQDEELLI